MDVPDQSSSQTDITVNRTIKLVHFSDGVEEEVEERHVAELKSEPMDHVDPKSLSWGPWLSHYAWKSGNNVIYAVDYAGESLANFFGITTPKYQLEISEHERMEEEKKKIDDESAGWVPNNGGGDIPLVLNEPSRDRVLNDV